MLCPACSAVVPDTAKVCGHCRAPISAGFDPALLVGS
jgi:predicted amidophosphoribosyltransferase